MRASMASPRKFTRREKAPIFMNPGSLGTLVGTLANRDELVVVLLHILLGVCMECRVSSRGMSVIDRLGDNCRSNAQDIRCGHTRKKADEEYRGVRHLHYLSNLPNEAAV